MDTALAQHPAIRQSMDINGSIMYLLRRAAGAAFSMLAMGPGRSSRSFAARDERWRAWTQNQKQWSWPFTTAASKR
jgi:hypothetical protein